MLKAILIDDEPDCVKLLSLQLKMYCPQVKVVAGCTESEEGLVQIQAHQPAVVFLDIEMPVMNGFQLLEKLGEIPFSLIFVTAYDQFAVKAFRFSALDYLLKPIDGKDLKMAVERVVRHRIPLASQVSLLRQHWKADAARLPDKIALPYQNGVTFTALKQIVLCESENNYTRVHTTDGHQHVVAKTLGDIQEVLEERNFLRIHRRYLINLDHIVKYVRGEGNYVILSNQLTVPVARNQKDKLIARFGWL